MVRLKAEACSNLQGFDILGNTEGGLGSGFLSKILRNIKDEFPDRSFHDFVQMESIEKEQGSAISVYN